MNQALSRIAEWEEFLRQELGEGWMVLCFERVQSTMDEAKKMDIEVSPKRPGLILARFQKAGRGRQGRKWEESSGALYATYVFALEKANPKIVSFPLVVGVCAKRVIRGCGGQICLKWPNDLLTTDKRKLGGILVESFSHEGSYFASVGVGINLSGVPQSQGQAVSLEEIAGVSLEPVEIAGKLGKELFEAWGKFNQDGFSAFRDEWLESAICIGDKISVDCGNETICGEYGGIDQDGRLLVVDNGAKRSVISGHLTFLE